eukprot:5891559-Amphidinium_carterae.1
MKCSSFILSAIATLKTEAATCARRRDGEEEVVVSRQTVDRVDAERMLRHCEIPAHTAPITAITMSEQGIWTVSQDGTLKPCELPHAAFELFPVLPLAPNPQSSKEWA